MRWILAILIISLLVFIHEFGHFIIAKINGVEVEEFSLGFGPTLISHKIGDTVYAIKALPFGGSCLMKGMFEAAEASLDVDDGEELLEADDAAAFSFEGQDNSLPFHKEDGDRAFSRDSLENDGRDDNTTKASHRNKASRQRQYVPEEGSFQAASPGRRAAITLAGPVFNFLLAFVAAVVIISTAGYDPALVMTVEEGSSAFEAGLREDDTITKINGHPITIGRDVDAYLNYHGLAEDESLSLTVKRGDETFDMTFKPDDVTVYRMGITYNLTEGPVTVSEIAAGSPLDEAGLKMGDVITTINGTALSSAEDLSAYLDAHPLNGSQVSLEYERDGAISAVSVTPTETTYRDIGFDYNLGRTETNAIGVLRYSAYEVKFWISMTVNSLKMFFTGEATVNDLSGPVGIANIVGETYEQARPAGLFMTFLNMLNLIILLSANLGVMNLLPIPGLDGGRMLFIIIEAILGRPVNKRFENTIQLVAAALLMALMFYVMFHDITQLFH